LWVGLCCLIPINRVTRAIAIGCIWEKVTLLLASVRTVPRYLCVCII
jgi:hypothetical protein